MTKLKKKKNQELHVANTASTYTIDKSAEQTKSIFYQKHPLKPFTGSLSYKINSFCKFPI